MGQGTLTGLAQLVAEELECDWARVTTEYPTPGQNLARERAWGNFSTGGSRGIRESHDYVRQGGAMAREMLVRAAAQGWGVPAADCQVESGVITHPASGRSTTYGAVAATAATLAPPKEITLKDPADWKIAGKPLKRLDTAEKLTGKQVYGIDLRLPGMLNAAIRDCPVFGGSLRGFDEAAVSGMPGVKRVVRVDEFGRGGRRRDLVAGQDGARRIADRVGRRAEYRRLERDDRFHAGGRARCRGSLHRYESGDARGALAAAGKVIEAVYGYPYQNHATMEPMNATAVWTPERCEVWTPTQNGEAALAATADAAGLPTTSCEVHKIHLGGGFGRRGAVHDWVRQAVAIAREMPGTPIKLIWSREEDMLHGRFHPITQCKLRAALDGDGNPTALHMRISGQSILAGVMPQRLQDGKDFVVFQGLNAGGAEAAIGYTFPNVLIDHAMRNPPVPPGFWRGVNLNHNAIYLECFVDELAHAAGQDPLEFRRKLMANHPKHLAVLEAAAAGAGWGSPPPEGVYRGLAQTMGFGSYVAGCAEVSVSPQGELKIHRIVAATDPGHAVNPQQIEAQVEGSFVYGLSAMLYGECTVAGGRMEQENFDTYQVMRINEMPVVETIVMPSGGFWGGVGEPTIAVAAPAVLNAIFAATGKRIRQLPLKHHDLATA